MFISLKVDLGIAYRPIGPPLSFQFDEPQQLLRVIEENEAIQTKPPFKLTLLQFLAEAECLRKFGVSPDHSRGLRRK
jgi:hypothetical protein